MASVHFLPNSKLAEVKEKLEELESEFWAAKKRFLENIPPFVKRLEGMAQNGRAVG